MNKRRALYSPRPTFNSFEILLFLSLIISEKTQRRDTFHNSFLFTSNLQLTTFATVLGSAQATSNTAYTNDITL